MRQTAVGVRGGPLPVPRSPRPRRGDPGRDGGARAAACVLDDARARRARCLARGRPPSKRSVRGARGRPLAASLAWWRPGLPPATGTPHPRCWRTPPSNRSRKPKRNPPRNQEHRKPARRRRSLGVVTPERRRSVGVKRPAAARCAGRPAGCPRRPAQLRNLGLRRCPAPTGNYAFDVNINTGIADLANDIRRRSRTSCSSGGWGWSRSSHGLIVMFEWCYSLEPARGADGRNRQRRCTRH